MGTSKQTEDSIKDSYLLGAKNTSFFKSILDDLANEPGSSDPGLFVSLVQKA